MFLFWQHLFKAFALLDWAGIIARIFDAYGNPKPIELGRQLGLDRATISKWMGKTRNPTIEHLAKIVADKHVTWDWLLEGRGPKFRESEKS